jgi:DNA polymerase V
MQIQLFTFVVLVPSTPPIPLFEAICPVGQANLRLVAQRISAGFPSPAADYIEDGLDLNEYLVRHPAASFLFTVVGYSMQGAGIVEGDKVVVDRSVTPRHNHIVIAVVDGEYTIKRLYKRGNRIELHPENPAFRPICFSDGQELEIWGVVVGLVRRCLA